MKNSGTLARVEIRRSSFEILIIFTLFGLAATSSAFSYSLELGFATAIAAAVSAIFAVPKLKQHVANLPPAVVLDRDGMYLRVGSLTDTLIPWSEIEDVSLRYSGRSDTLRVKLRHPEKYIGRAMRINMALSSYDLSFPTSVLDCLPTELLEKVDAFRKAYA